VVFESDGAVLTSDSTLRFRHRDEVTASLAAAGYVVDEVRQAPDRPGRELVFIARRADVGSTGTGRPNEAMRPAPTCSSTLGLRNRRPMVTAGKRVTSTRAGLR
jgi:hypothetical protein